MRVNVNETFYITASLVDETTGYMATGKTVYYDLRLQPGDTALSPPVSGTLEESLVEAGVYSSSALSLDTPGNYIAYTTSSGFTSEALDITILEEDPVADLVRQNRHYNTSVEDVIRTNTTATASQTLRKVGMGKTDYVITRLKADSDPDWTTSTVSGVIWAWYRNLDDDVPYKMAGPGV
jgi:hypothetical protein